MYMILFRVCDWSHAVQKTTHLRLVLGFLSGLGMVVSGLASANEEMERVGSAIPAAHTPYVPSSQFAQMMMLSQATVSLLEPGVLAIWSPNKAFPHRIFVAGDGIEAFGLCIERESIGCTVGTLNHETKEISTYIMPLAFAERLDTFTDLLGTGEPHSSEIVLMRTEQYPGINLSTPAARFARLLVENPSPVREIEPGVVAVGFLNSSDVGSVFVGLDGLQAFATCGQVQEGCSVSLFDYQRGTIQNYSLPVPAVLRADTYVGLVHSLK